MSLYIVVRIGELSSITLAGAARAVQGDPGSPCGQARAGRSLQGDPGICLRSRNHQTELSIENYTDDRFVEAYLQRILGTCHETTVSCASPWTVCFGTTPRKDFIFCFEMHIRLLDY